MDITSFKKLESVICIPTIWNNWNEFMLALINNTQGEYMAAGKIMMNVKEKFHFEIDFTERDDRIKDSFQFAGMVTRVSESFINEIDEHKSVIYLIGETGNLESADRIAKATVAILNAGGIGVKIETTGKAFEKQSWIRLCENPELHKLYEMFVIDSIKSEDAVFSCGMHNIGFKDTVVSGLEFQDAVDLISIFSYYQIIDEPEIKDGQTFSPDADAPIYRITEEKNQPYLDHELFGNPFGMWRLTEE